MDVGRSYRPLIAVVLISIFAAGLAFVFIARTMTIVRAPVVLYPKRYVELRSPVRLGKVTEVLKTDGAQVTEGENLVLLDAENEKFQREAIRKQVIGVREELKERERLLDQRKVKVEMARAAVKEAQAEVGIEKGRLLSAESAVARMGTQASELEIRIATEKWQYAIKSEEEAKLTYENNVEAVRTNAIPEIEMRKSRLAYEQSKTLTVQRKDELELMKTTETVYRLANARGEAHRYAASVKTAEARVGLREVEVQEAEIMVPIDERSRFLIADLERLGVEEKRIERLMSEKVLRAPSSGLLTDFHVQSGQWLSDRVPLGMIYDNSTMIIHAHVQQKDYGRVQVGQKAKIFFDALPSKDDVIEAEVLSVEPMATPPKLDPVQPMEIFVEPKGSYLPRALVKLKLKDSPKNAKLRAGFTGAVKILVNEKNALAEWFF